MIVIGDRWWEIPKPRITWTEAKTHIRELLDLRFQAQLAEETLDSAVTAAVQNAYPKTFQMELWRTELTENPEYIGLPWQPEQVVFVAWKKIDDTTTHGETIPAHYWTCEQDHWRWVGPSHAWPSWPVHWAMRAYGRPQTPANSPAFCTVDLQYLVPLVEAELGVHLARNAAMPHIEAIQLARRLRLEALAPLPSMQRPASLNKPHNPTVSTVYFKDWGTTAITFDDLP